ncbi:MAG TPA: AAA family ATPase, partial [Hyphomonadaceae bacterium]|nr:AAA family ATPase [Hyphomonadaceae bacterium]
MSEAATANAPSTDIVKEADAAVQLLAQVRAEIGKVVFGQERVVELVLATILAGGHALLIGAPGLAKTKLVETTARALG